VINACAPVLNGLGINSQILSQLVSGVLDAMTQTNGFDS
jgi:hypothetical protein